MISDVTKLFKMTLLIGSFAVQKPVPDMTYNVFGGTLNLTQSIKLSPKTNEQMPWTFPHREFPQIFYSRTVPAQIPAE